MQSNPIIYKSFQFSVKIITLYQYQIREKKEYVLSKQLLRSGTSIEAQDAQSKKDFISKMSISLKEAKETRYWLDLLEECGYLQKTVILMTHKQKSFAIGEVFLDIEELIKMLSAIVKTSKQQ